MDNEIEETRIDKDHKKTKFVQKFGKDFKK